MSYYEQYRHELFTGFNLLQNSDMHAFAMESFRPKYEIASIRLTKDEFALLKPYFLYGLVLASLGLNNKADAIKYANDLKSCGFNFYQKVNPLITNGYNNYDIARLANDETN
ncbi:MAG: hypothetical protein A2X82_11660 [Geobacteraceae bacterium GWC2_55_20]|nr:MAG: hypothetical protein A2X82_11660 [Geobacteraceae bacterium GWC2_55_20]OGU23348.1 MAG: hypothetical protein A2X85_17755 [Geobacteraceae bacterium GWF2_54_21]HCE66870.1 hypothetical protein [Geobacter sp.]